MQTVERLRSNPGIGAPWNSTNPRLGGIRRYPIVGFQNHFVFYRVVESSLDLLHIYHGHQDIDERLGTSE